MRKYKNLNQRRRLATCFIEEDSEEATKAVHTLGTRNVGSDYLMGAV